MQISLRAQRVALAGKLMVSLLVLMCINTLFSCIHSLSNILNDMFGGRVDLM